MGQDTVLSGTETPYRKTPPSNIGTDAERQATGRPPTNGALAQSTAAAGSTPVCTVAPVFTGTQTVGNTLTVTGTGTWVPAAGSFTYQWFRRKVNPVSFEDPDTPIVGATTNARVLAAGDVGFRIFCRVTGLDAVRGGSSPADTQLSNIIP